MTKQIVKRYSQAFKQQVVREYEAGSSVNALQKKYGIGGTNTIRRWIQQYSPAGYRTEKVVIQTVEDQVEFQAMRARIRELEAALAESVLEARMLKAIVETASEHLGMNLKKDFGKRAS